MSSEQQVYAGPTSGERPSGPRAGFWIRVGAVLIDGIGLAVVSVVLELAIGRTGQIISIGLALAYYTYFEGSGAGQTVGKRLCGIRVIDFNTGGPIGYPRAAVRYLASIISGFVILLGYLWMLWDGEKQTWHDKWSSSVVVPVSAYPVERWPG